MNNVHINALSSGNVGMTKGTSQTVSCAGTFKGERAREATPAISPTANARHVNGARKTATDGLTLATTGATTAEESTSNKAAAMTDAINTTIHDAATTTEDARSPATSAAPRTTSMGPNVPVMPDASDVTTYRTSPQRATNPARSAAARLVSSAPMNAKLFGLAGPTTTTRRAALQCQAVWHSNQLPLSRPG